jgi:hypothetical protein
MIHVGVDLHNNSSLGRSPRRPGWPSRPQVSGGGLWMCWRSSSSSRSAPTRASSLPGERPTAWMPNGLDRSPEVTCNAATTCPLRGMELARYNSSMGSSIGILDDLGSFKSGLVVTPVALPVGIRRADPNVPEGFRSEGPSHVCGKGIYLGREA